MTDKDWTDDSRGCPQVQSGKYQMGHIILANVTCLISQTEWGHSQQRCGSHSTCPIGVSCTLRYVHPDEAKKGSLRAKPPAFMV